ncbi:MAG TPA: GWxTD domain-containing protein [Patescibacteria group bacterium]|nr:GWxTD domain-containing protein [Patescibacteria group bacterium]
MARARRVLIAAVIGLISILPSHPDLRHADWTTANRGWARGPVWYIMTNAEYRDYRRMHSEPARRDFIRQFWQQRDPLPDTTDNELEHEFWHRVSVADDHFGQEIKPGWKTERGKVFIMLGPPENFDHDHILADTYGASRWMYDLGSMPVQLRLVLQDSLGIPVGRRFVKLKVRQENLATRSVNNAVPLQTSILRPTDFLPLAETLVRRMPGPDALRNLGYVMRVPEVMERSRSHVDVTTLFSLVPMQARIDFRPPLQAAAPRADGTTVAVTLGVTQTDLLKAGVASSQPGAAILTGYLTSIADDKKSFQLNGAFAPDPSPDSAAPAPASQVFQAVCHVPPGRYLLDVSYQDTERRIMGSLRDLIDVPSFETQGLGVSSLMLASRLEKLEEVADSGSAEMPFMLGRYRVIPRTNQVYHPEEALTVFYQITGGARGGDGLAHLDLSYQFYLQDAGTWLPVGPLIQLENQSDLEQAWSVPLEGMPPGRYRLELTVMDQVTETTSIRGALFEIAPLTSN